MLRSSLFACWLCMWLALPVAGCDNGSAAQTPPTNPTPTPPAWRVDFILSGGFVGSQRVMELSDTGTLIIIDKKNDTHITHQVPNEELVRIYALLVETKQLQPSSNPPACRDCFQYDLDVRMDGQRFSFQVNDLNMSKAGLTPLVKALNDLQERALAGQF